MKLSKRDIVTIVSERTSLSKAKTTEVFDEIFDYIKDVISKDYDVSITGFGSFYKREKIIGKIKVPNIDEPLTNVKSVKCKFKMHKTFFKDKK